MSGQTIENNEFGSANQESGIYSYHLTLFSDADEIYELWLPKVPEGFFRFSSDPQHRFLSICAKDGKWIASCQKPAFFKEVPLANSYEIPLSGGELLKVSIEERTYLVLTEKVIPDRNIFHNYNIQSEVEISIGNQPECDIYYRGPFVSRKHAVLSRFHGRWVVRCLDGLYGMFINKEKRAEAELKLGDVIYIMGLKIIIGQTFLSINSGLGEVVVNPRILQETPTIHSSHSHYYNEDVTSETDKYFNRAPRKRREVEQRVITVEGPPMSMSQKRMPLLLRMGSSMVMGGAAALAGNFLSLLTSVLFPFMNNKYSESERQEYEKLRLTKYTEYLQKKRQEIVNAVNYEYDALNEKYPHVNSLTEPGQLMKHLWERRPCDSDFLQLRLGTGTRRLSATIEYPSRSFELEQDALEDKMYQLVETPYYVENAPIVLSLMDTFICGIQGQREQVIEFIKLLALQTAILHSYDEVKMVFLIENQELDHLDAVRYLPHVWDDQRTIRFVATNEAEVYAVGEYIKAQVNESEGGEKKELRQILKKRPYYVIFALNKKLFDGHEVFKQILQEDNNLGASIITAHDALPKESQKIITLKTPQKNICTTMGIDGGEDESFALDAISQQQTKQTTRELSNIFLKKVTQAQAMPKMVTFLEMFKVGRIEQLNPLKRWRENNPTKSLAAPVGVGEDGSAFMLDLHEKRQGPHGLVAGITGSGKSEFLITYILSMAVNYHPDEVAFVLIDYKGGGLASAFENPQTGVRLPHLVGTITNLDGASIQRSLLSIESELLRRQRIFNEVTSATNEGTMNIYTYQKLYRAGKVSEPMPHLFIISDEFAELKQQQPEFMEDLISAARIGRSLGIHLILATQKPAGVVNDQIRSNTKFRVCLRVQERSDSMDMLKRPEAAELIDTGRFYLQVGYNEYFALGQSAWCGAPYEPQDTVAVQRDDAIEFVDITGQVTARTKPKVRKVDTGTKQIVAVVEYLDALAKSHNIAARQLWQPELPTVLDLDELQSTTCSANAPMSVCLGLLDDPENQSQFPLVLDFETCGNLLIAGEAGSGKTTVIQNIIYLLSKQLSPKEFNFYGLDYSSRMMKQFKPLPHCGALLQEEDAGSLDEFFSLINNLIAERKQIFSELEVDNFREARKHRDIPLVVVFIDNFAGIGTTKNGEAHTYKFQSYLKNSAVYGIKYIISCSHIHEVSSKVRQEITEQICLHLRDKYDYSEALGCKVSYYPPEIPGRGLFKYNERPHGLQNAMISAELDNRERASYIKHVVGSICASNRSRCEVQHLPVMDEGAEYAEFAAQFKHGRIPLGYSKRTGKPVALPLKQFGILSLYFGNSNGMKPILTNLLHSAQKEEMELWIIKRKQHSLFSTDRSDGIPVSDLLNADYLSSETEDLRLLQQALLATIEQRKQQASNEPILLLIESVADFCDSLSAVAVLSYCTILEKAHKYGIHVVGCFEPGIPAEKSNNALVSLFAQKDIILFGGQYDKQSLYSFNNVAGAEKSLPYNMALMVYRQQMHPMVMPCGKIEQEEIDSDLDNIF